MELVGSPENPQGDPGQKASQRGRTRLSSWLRLSKSSTQRSSQPPKVASRRIDMRADPQRRTDVLPRR
ncbi:MAG: hypothetical protein J0H43_02110, partial [Actinobacteria bacterium]|nr:hypothetical protein [Actinomycetota bacterium]